MQSKLIIEAGGTSSQVVCGTREHRIEFSFRGLNGNLHGASYINDFFKDLIVDTGQVDRIYFYGAGVNNNISRKLLSDVVNEIYGVEPMIESDMLASCRALLQQSAGHCFILGTGANACYYDGERIVESRSGLGILLGDEGSGAYIGKLFIQDFLNEALPEDVKNMFQDRYSLTRKDIIEAVYHGESASKWLGQFAKYIAEHKDHHYFNKLIQSNFKAFIEMVLLKFNQPVATLVGNGGFVNGMESEFEQVLRTYDLSLQKVALNAIEGLKDFHL